MSLLGESLVFLAAAVVAVPLFKRLGLGAVLGYLCAGVVIGPSCIGLIANVESTLHFAEFGVVLLLFLIGLELQPSRLWELRRAVFAVGSAQVAATAALLALAAAALGLPPAAAVVAGIGLSLSSTAFALQFLAEKNQLSSPHGRAAFGILLFQDLAVIPLLAILPLLAVAVAPAAGDATAAAGPPGWPPGQGSGGAGPLLWWSVAKVLLTLAGVGAAGRFLVRPVFRFVASMHMQELFTATALLVVVGTALVVNQVGLSMALGAFLAGVLLADSEYRHELEADIEPFKGLLLGLFFIAVGMSVRLPLVVERPGTVALLVAGLTAAKLLTGYLIGRLHLADRASAASLAVVISQGGEFAFVLFNLAVGFGVMDRALTDLLVVVVSLSMALTPLLFAALERLVLPRLERRDTRDFDALPDHEPPVIIAGFGRVGQVVGRLLRAKHIPFTALDASPEHIDFVRRFGNKVFYGDASRLDLLRAARADKARLFVCAIDDVESSLRTVEMVQQHFPHLVIFARARNRQHAYRLLNLGVPHIMRETLLSSLEMTREVLEELGLPWSEAHDAVERFREHDERLLRATFGFHKDEKRLAEMADRARQELEELFEKDAADRRAAGG